MFLGLLPPASPVTVPKLLVSLGLRLGVPKVCRLNALIISALNVKACASNSVVRFRIEKSSLKKAGVVYSFVERGKLPNTKGVPGVDTFALGSTNAAGLNICHCLGSPV